ncbi:UNVERIFIED_CONTAM: hypothetical protein PYX00_006156 [Menopon gallinae]|uniref:Uncharacterized protein n=1 Tax=Menopon gallinae TaxID=328185 RepID=A0AAW2HVH0_9NEOP
MADNSACIPIGSDHDRVKKSGKVIGHIARDEGSAIFVVYIRTEAGERSFSCHDVFHFRLQVRSDHPGV